MWCSRYNSAKHSIMPDKVDSFLFISHFRNCDGGEESLFNMTVLTCHTTDVPPTNGAAMVRSDHLWLPWMVRLY